MPVLTITEDGTPRRRAFRATLDLVSYLLGLLIAFFALTVLVLTAWAVDRLDAVDRGPRRVLWRPWYRTAIFSAASLLIGLVLGTDVESAVWTFRAVFLLLLVLQLWTASGLALHMLETLALCLALFCGMALLEWLIPETPPARGFGGTFYSDTWRAFFTCSVHFLILSAIGLPAIIVRRIVTRMLKTSEIL